MHLFPLFLCLFTQVYLLIDGYVKGQYVTPVHMFSLEKQKKMLFHKTIFRLKRDIEDGLGGKSQANACSS